VAYLKVIGTEFNVPMNLEHVYVFGARLKDRDFGSNSLHFLWKPVECNTVLFERNAADYGGLY
jgi:hypothetical protein